MRARAFLMSSWLMVFAGFAAAEEISRLRLHGSNTVGAELAPALIEAWLSSKGFTDLRIREIKPEERLITAQRGDERIAVEVHAHGSTTAFRDLLNRTGDMGMASRPVKPQEVQALSARGRLDGPQSEFVLGLDGIAVIVHPSNPLPHLDKETLADIFSGRIADWSQLGAPGGRIQVYARDDKSGTYDTFKSLVLGKRPLEASARRFESNAELSDAVAADRHGIGFVGLPYVRHSRLLGVSEAGTLPVVPTPFSVATEDYALARRLFLYVPDDAPPVARELAEFAVSSAGQAQVSRAEFVAQTILEGDAPPVADAPEEYRELVQDARRVSLNFRFRAGSTQLDNKGLRDLERLVAYLERPENRGRELMLFGFADANETLPLHSLELSIHRADQIGDLLIRRGIGPRRIRGYGQAVPVASNADARGRQKNRRVEVWLR